MLLDGQTSDDAGDDAADLKALTDGAGAAGGEEPAAAAEAAPEPNKPVALTEKKSRRAQAEEDRKTELRTLSDSVKEMRDGLSARDRQIGELTGHLAALAQQRQAAPMQPPATAPPMPDPDELLAKATAALDVRDMTGYHRLLLQAGQAANMRQMAPVLAEVQRYRAQAPAAPQVPPALMQYFAAYPQVATHPQAMQLLMAKNAELTARGWRDGPEKVKAIFDEVQGIVTTTNGQHAPRPGFDRGSAAALSGTPTARSASGGSGGKGEPRVDLTPEERFYWKKAGFTDESELAQNIAKSRPDRIIR